VFEDQPPSAGHGEYWFTAVDPLSGQELAQSPVVTEDERNVGADAMSGPGEPSRNLRYHHHDHLGSTRRVTDEKGVVVEQRKFYPFGMDALTTASPETRLAFTGHERDTALALDYMKARYCSPSLGRFHSVDPVEGEPAAPQSWNRFTYVSNNPMRLIDPQGLQEENPGDATPHLAPNEDQRPSVTFHGAAAYHDLKCTVVVTPAGRHTDDLAVVDGIAEGSGRLANLLDKLSSFLGLGKAAAKTQKKLSEEIAVSVAENGKGGVDWRKGQHRSKDRVIQGAQWNAGVHLWTRIDRAEGFEASSEPQNAFGKWRRYMTRDSVFQGHWLYVSDALRNARSACREHYSTYGIRTD
jgi:RHS repeat-associated protein